MASVFVKRCVAYIADFFVVSAFMWIISYLLYLFANPYFMYAIYSYFVYVVPILCVVYFTLCEKYKGSSVGKALLFLEVKSRNGADISWVQAFARNLTKIFWVPIIFDWAIGKILRKDDRILNSLTKTVVVDEIQQ